MLEWKNQEKFRLHGDFGKATWMPHLTFFESCTSLNIPAGVTVWFMLLLYSSPSSETNSAILSYYWRLMCSRNDLTLGVIIATFFFHFSFLQDNIEIIYLDSWPLIISVTHKSGLGNESKFTMCPFIPLLFGGFPKICRNSSALFIATVWRVPLRCWPQSPEQCVHHILYALNQNVSYPRLRVCVS